MLFTLSEEIDSDLQWKVRDCQEKCIDSAGQAIDLIYDTFHNDSFFQTWYGFKNSYLSDQEQTTYKLTRWYNSTYTLFAVSILLTAIFHKFAKTKQEF